MLTGVILAGGQSRRMGTNKALLPFGEEVLIQRQLRIMRQICSELIVVCNEPSVFRELIEELGVGVQWTADLIPGKGPLSGMQAACRIASYDDLWVVGCDMPFVSAEAARLLWEIKQANSCDAVIPEVGDLLQPLHGIYSLDTFRSIDRLLQAGKFRVKDWLDTIQYQVVSEPVFREQGVAPHFVMNLNTPEDYQRAIMLHHRFE